MDTFSGVHFLFNGIDIKTKKKSYRRYTAQEKKSRILQADD
jgi:hypothetical protein